LAAAVRNNSMTSVSTSRDHAPAPSPAAAARQPFRSLLILVAILVAIGAGYAQMALDIGQTPQEFSADSDATLRVASWAFSIWGLIYAALFAYAVYQTLPRTPATPFLRRLAWPSLLAFLGIGAWIFAAAYDAEWLTIALIVGSAAVLIVPLAAAGPTQDDASNRERWLAAYPLALLAGWLSIASAVNILTVLTGNGQLPSALPPMAWAVGAIVIVALVALWVLARTRLWIFAVPIIWGLAGAFSAERAKGDLPLAWTALGVALLLAVAASMSLRRR
jgi:hypothetical protein